MPIDYLSRRKLTESDVSDLVQDRDIEDELSRSAKNVQELRNRFLERSNALISQQSPTGRSSIFSRLSEIDPQIQSVIARQRMKLQKQKSDAVFNNAYNLAVQYGLDEQDAANYARRYQQQTEKQAFESSESENVRRYKERLNKLAEQYGFNLQGLYDEFRPSRDISPELIGTSLGVATQIGLDRYLRNKYLQNSSYRPYTTQQLPVNESLRIGSKFSTPLDVYGRRI